MLLIVQQIIQGIVTGIVGPVFTFLGKKQDATLEGAKAGMTADVANNAAWFDFYYKMEALKIQAMQWWGPRLLYMIVGGAAAIHAASIYLDSTFRFGWGIAKAPAPYDQYEAWVIGSLFVVSLAKGPLSAATAWLHRK